MATPTNSEKIRKARSAGEMFANIADAVDAQRVPQMAEFISGVVSKIGLKELIDEFCNTITDGTPAMKKKFSLEFAELLRKHQQMTGDGMTKDEVTRMSDECMEAILVENYGFVKGHAMTDAARDFKLILERHGAPAEAWQEVVTLMTGTYGAKLTSNDLAYGSGA